MEKKKFTELRIETKFYDDGTAVLYINDDKVGVINQDKGENFLEAQEKMIKEHFKNNKK